MREPGEPRRGSITSFEALLAELDRAREDLEAWSPAEPPVTSEPASPDAMIPTPDVTVAPPSGSAAPGRSAASLLPQGTRRLKDGLGSAVARAATASSRRVSGTSRAFARSVAHGLSRAFRQGTAAVLTTFGALARARRSTSEALRRSVLRMRGAARTAARTAGKGSLSAVRRAVGAVRVSLRRAVVRARGSAVRALSGIVRSLVRVGKAVLRAVSSVVDRSVTVVGAARAGATRACVAVGDGVTTGARSIRGRVRRGVRRAGQGCVRVVRSVAAASTFVAGKTVGMVVRSVRGLHAAVSSILRALRDAVHGTLRACRLASRRIVTKSVFLLVASITTVLAGMRRLAVSTTRGVASTVRAIVRLARRAFAALWGLVVSSVLAIVAIGYLAALLLLTIRDALVRATRTARDGIVRSVRSISDAVVRATLTAWGLLVLAAMVVRSVIVGSGILLAASTYLAAVVLRDATLRAGRAVRDAFQRAAGAVRGAVVWAAVMVVGVAYLAVLSAFEMVARSVATVWRVALWMLASVRRAVRAAVRGSLRIVRRIVAGTALLAVCVVVVPALTILAIVWWAGGVAVSAGNAVVAMVRSSVRRAFQTVRRTSLAARERIVTAALILSVVTYLLLRAALRGVVRAVRAVRSAIRGLLRSLLWIARRAAAFAVAVVDTAVGVVVAAFVGSRRVVSSVVLALFRAVRSIMRTVRNVTVTAMRATWSGTIAAGERLGDALTWVAAALVRALRRAAAAGSLAAHLVARVVRSVLRSTVRLIWASVTWPVRSAWRLGVLLARAIRAARPLGRAADGVVASVARASLLLQRPFDTPVSSRREAEAARRAGRVGVRRDRRTIASGGPPRRRPDRSSGPRGVRPGSGTRRSGRGAIYVRLSGWVAVGLFMGLGVFGIGGATLPYADAVATVGAPSEVDRPGDGIVVEVPEAPEEPAADEQVVMPMAQESRPAPPVTLRIPSIDVDAGVVPVGLEPDGAMEIPSDVRTVGWYDPFAGAGLSPGEPGTAVIAGHVDSRVQGRGAFWFLRELSAGDIVEVVHEDGTLSTWLVESVVRYPKDDIPIEEIFAFEGPSRLALITCGGEFDRSIGSYLENYVVTAVPTLPAAREPLRPAFPVS
jgi:hypothetical protein